MHGNADNSPNNIRINPFQHPLILEDVETVVKRSLGFKTKVINFYVKNFSEDKVGFMGAHRHLVVTFQKDGSNKKEITSYFLKMIPHDVAEQAAVIEECNVFYKEATIYNEVIPELVTTIQDKSFSAQCYLVKEDAMVFEDLKHKNFKVKDKILDIVSLKSALTALAKLHASSILTEKRLGKTFLELYPNLVKECLFVRTGRFSKFISCGIDAAVAIAQHLGLIDTDIPKICDHIFEAVSPSKTEQNVICHGDAWSFNLMFDDSQPVPMCVLVDWQLVRYAPMTTDILQMIYQTTRREFREKNEEELLRHYHEVICETLRKQDKEICMPTFSEILREYEGRRVVGIVTAAINFQVNLINGKMCADLTRDSAGFSKMMFQDRVDLVLDIMQKDSYYSERISEIIRELVQRSKQLL